MTAVAVDRAAVPLARDLVALLKLRIDALVAAVAVAAAVAAGTTAPGTLVVLAAACLLASAGASALNHYIDRDLDARMARTRKRPIPSGRLGNPRVALWLGLFLVGLPVAAAWPALGGLPALYLLAGALTYAVVYSWWLKPRTPYSIVLGGAAGSFAALAGWQTGQTTVAAAPLLLALVLFLWTPSHFWSLAIVLERDYRAAGLPMLSALQGAKATARAVVVNTLALVGASFALAFFVPWPYAAAAVPAGIGFLAVTVGLALRPDTGRAWRAFKLSGLYLLIVLVGLVLTVVV